MNIDASGATFAPTGKTYQLATTQDHWAIDATGAPTLDPSEAVKGALLPFGGAKGANVALLVEVLAEFAAPPNGIYAVFPQRKHLPLRVRLWIEHLRQHYSQPEYWQRSGG